MTFEHPICTYESASVFDRPGRCYLVAAGADRVTRHCPGGAHFTYILI